MKTRKNLKLLKKSKAIVKKRGKKMKNLCFITKGEGA